MIEKIHNSMVFNLNGFFPYIDFWGECYHSSMMISSDRYTIIVAYFGVNEFYGISIKRDDIVIYDTKLPYPEVIEETIRVLASCPDIKSDNRDHYINQILDE